MLGFGVHAQAVLQRDPCRCSAPGRPWDGHALLGLSTWARLGAPRKVPTAGSSCGLGQAGPAATPGGQRAERGGPRRRGNRHKNNSLQCAAHRQACSLGTSEPPQAPCPGVPGVVSPRPVLCLSPVTAGLGWELSPHTCLISPSQEDPPSGPGIPCLRRKRATSLNRSLRPKAAVAQGGGVCGGCRVRGLRRCGGRREGERGGQRTTPSCAHRGLSCSSPVVLLPDPRGHRTMRPDSFPPLGLRPQGPGEALRACGSRSLPSGCGSDMEPGPAWKSFLRGMIQGAPGSLWRRWAAGVLSLSSHVSFHMCVCVYACRCVCPCTCIMHWLSGRDPGGERFWRPVIRSSRAGIWLR